VYGKVCSIVQARFDFYGTQFMSKSLSFSWCWLGSAAYHGQNLKEYGRLFGVLTDLIEEGRIRPHLTKRLRLTAGGLKEAHRILESGNAVGKIAQGPDVAGEGEPFY
jgi:NADPH:quinone reductase-like Zn-dependent oxidoreductase